LAVIYLFLGRFKQLKPFWTFHTQLFYIIDKKMKDETEIQDGVHSKKNVIFRRQTDGNFLVKNHFFIHKKF
jgi:hypothetical protein